MEKLIKNSIELLKKLISIPSFSRQENETADAIEAHLRSFGVTTNRSKNNIWAFNEAFDEAKPTILLNSHHDTVKPNKDYSRDPFFASQEDGMLFGLGSNDAGGSLVSLMATFLYFYDKADLNYNLCFLASAEEEISGKDGIESVFPLLGKLDFAIVGEPTLMNLAIAEKGLMVLDCVAPGKSGHAAREEGENAIYNALEDILWLKNYRFPKESETLGPIKMSVTMVNAGTQHNVVPATCDFVVDVRTTDAYTNLEVLEIINAHTKSSVKARSTRLNPSSIPLEHPIVQAGLALGRKTYGSPTISDQALLNIPSLKMGPGDSARSHMADEFIYITEIEEAIPLYIQLLEAIL